MVRSAGSVRRKGAARGVPAERTAPARRAGRASDRGGGESAAPGNADGVARTPLSRERIVAAAIQLVAEQRRHVGKRPARDGFALLVLHFDLERTGG